jgi:hypothetical protein
MAYSGMLMRCGGPACGKALSLLAEDAGGEEKKSLVLMD